MVSQRLHRIDVRDQISGFRELKLGIKMVQRAEQLNPKLRRIEDVSVSHSEGDSRNRLPMRRIVVRILRNGKARRCKAHAGNFARRSGKPLAPEH